MVDLFSPDKDALIAKWKHVIDIIGPHNKWDTHFELAWICEAASQQPGLLSHVARYLEVGSYMGASMKAALLASPLLCGVTLDTFDDAGTAEAYMDLLHNETRSGRLQTFQGPSEEGFKLIKGPFDLAFIDASHLYDGVKADITAALPMMRPGAILCGHDYRPDAPEDGVTKAVRELLPGYKNVADSIWCFKCP
jgi:predicted O-methyltransferase YrrM